MYQAITVKFVPFTEARGNYAYRATCAAKARTYDQVDSADPRTNALLAAQQLAGELGWHGKWHGGVTKAGDHVFVLVTDDERDSFTIAKAKRPR